MIKDFSLDIMPGEVMCLLGNNGSGKTTIIQMLTGLCKPDSNTQGDSSIKAEKNGTRVSLERQRK